MDSFYSYLDSPAGLLQIGCTTTALTHINWQAQQSREPATHLANAPPVLSLAIQQLDEYFAGKRHTFDLPLYLDGTPFQQKAWHALSAIPFGKTISYQALANTIQHPGAARAAGSAIGKNPFSIVLPCHRVIAANGGLGGYAGGLSAKKTLLALEQHYCQSASALNQRDR